jgi:hypothetical protein
MDLSFLGNFDWSKITTFMIAVWGTWKQIDKWLTEHQSTIDSIILAVEKKSKDGWTNQEKKDFAIDLYNDHIKNNIRWYLRPVIKWFILPKIEKFITEKCVKANKIKTVLSL